MPAVEQFAPGLELAGQVEQCQLFLTFQQVFIAVLSCLLKMELVCQPVPGDEETTDPVPPSLCLRRR